MVAQHRPKWAGRIDKMEPKTIYIDEGVMLNLAYVVVVYFNSPRFTDDNQRRQYVEVYTVGDHMHKCFEPYIPSLRMAMNDIKANY